MLKVFRDNLKYLSWILWAVIALFVLFVFVDFGSGLGQQGQPTATAARVGGEAVTLEEFQRQYQQLERLYRQVYGEQFTPELAKQIRLPIQALDRAVNEKILLAEAERLGIEVTDTELRDSILALDVFKDEKGRFIGQEKYAEILRANQMNIASFERDMRRDLMMQKLNNILMANVYVGDDEVERAYRDQVERAKIRYVQLPRNRFLQGAEIPRNELTSYFEAHKDEYRLPEQREGAYLLVDSAKLAGQVQVSDQDLQAYYQEHRDEFSQEEQVRARHILVNVNDQRPDEQARQRAEEAKKRIAGGADFAAVAREFSEDQASKESGGDLGYFGRNRMVKEFEEAAFGAAPGQLVGPVKSSFGYHLLEVTDKRPGGVRPFAEVRDSIRARLASERVQQTAETRARELAGRLAKEKPQNAEALEAIARENPALTFARTGKFGERDPVTGIGISAPFSTAAFGLEKGQVSEPVQVPRGWALFYLQEIHEPRTPELSEVEPRVRLAVANQKQQKMAMERLQQVRREVAAGKAFDQAASELGLEVKETEEFGGEGSVPGIGYNPELAKAALALKAGQVGGPVADAQGALLFQVTERKDWDRAQYATAKEQTRSRLQQEKLTRLQAALVEQRRRELGVDYDRRLLQEFGMDPSQQS
jgi:peptidyl-prolyl cis-trans isomerase D